MIASTFTLAGLLALVAAAPSRRQAPVFPPHSQSNTFTLVANVTKAVIEPNLHGYNVGSYHVAAGAGYAVLYPSSSAEGRPLFLNGTAEEVRYNQATLNSWGGTPVRTLPERSLAR